MIKEARGFGDILDIIPIERDEKLKHPNPHSMPVEDYMHAMECLLSGKSHLDKRMLKVFLSHGEDGGLDGYLFCYIATSKIPSFNELRIIKGWQKDGSDSMVGLFNHTLSVARSYGVKALRIDSLWDEKLIESLERKYKVVKTGCTLTRYSLEDI